MEYNVGMESRRPGCFKEGRIPQQKLQDGRPFPKVIQPSPNSQPESNMNSVLESIGQQREWLERELRECGAILFRGFPLRSASHFGAFVEAFGWEEQPYNGIALRAPVAGRVHTASDRPLDQHIFFHHEMRGSARQNCSSSARSRPRRAAKPPLFGATEWRNDWKPALRKLQRGSRARACFPARFCRRRATPASSPARAGVRCSRRTILQRLRRGSRKPFRLSNPLHCFRVSACKILPAVVSRAAEAGARIRWMEDGSAEMIRGPIAAIRAFRGYDRKVLLNCIPATIFIRPSVIRFTFCDGSAIPAAVEEECVRAMEEECVEVQWEAGDVLLIDNLAVMHARRPSVS